MHPDFDWHVICEQGQQIWLCLLDTRLVEGDVVSLAVWPIPRSAKWEWEILAISGDQHVHGGSASSLGEAMEAAEAAALIIADETSKVVGSRITVPSDYYPDSDVLTNVSSALSQFAPSSLRVVPNVT
jgi:hypothetical protein